MAGKGVQPASSTRPRHRSRNPRRQVMVGAFGVFSFLLVTSGGNIPNSLVPLYAADLQLSPFAQSALLSTFVGAMTVSLLLFAFLRVHRYAFILVMAALGLMAAADALMLCAPLGVQWFVGARLLSGLAVGIGTGSASALALSGLGEKARTMVASGAVIGALAGNAGTGALASVLPNPTVLPYVMHLVLVALAVLIFGPFAGRSWREEEDRGGLQTLTRDHTSGSPFKVRHRFAAYLLGGLAWTNSGLITALTPTVIRTSIPEATLFMAIAPMSVLLAVGALVQFWAAKRLFLLRGWYVLIPLGVGFSFVAVSVSIQSFPALLIACALMGLGQGPAYSLGLGVTTYGASPAKQARLVSAYSSATYAMCACGITGLGIVASATSVATAFQLAAVGTVAVGLIVIGAGGRHRVSVAPHNSWAKLNSKQLPIINSQGGRFETSSSSAASPK